MKKYLPLAFALFGALMANADILPAKSLRNGGLYFIYDAHGDDGTTTPHDKDTNYRYAFRYDAGDSGIAGNHVKAATAIAEGRTFDSDYVWRAREVNGKWQFENVGTAAYITGGSNTGNAPATMELEPTTAISQFTLRMAGSSNNRWDGDYHRTGYFWNYQYSYPFVWWEGEGHPYEFYEATPSGSGVYSFTNHDRTKIDLIAQRALELKNKGLFTASAYSTASVAIAHANSNDEALEAINALLASIASAHLKTDSGILTLTPAKGGYSVFVEHDNTLLDGTHTLTATLKNIEAGTVRFLNKDMAIEPATPEEAAAEHLSGALALTVDWVFSPEPGHVSVSAETNEAWLAAEQAQGQSIAAMRQAADALFAANPHMSINLPKAGQFYAINYQYVFGLTYNNFLAAEGSSLTTSRTPQPWKLIEADGQTFLARHGAMLCAADNWQLSANGTPLQIEPTAEPDANGVYPFTIASQQGALAFEFHIMKADVVRDSAPTPVYLTNAADDSSSIAEISSASERSEGIFDLQGRRVNNPGRGLYIINGRKVLR